MTLSKDGQEKLDQGVAELRKLEGKVSSAQVLACVDIIPDPEIKRFLWACIAVAACFMQQDQLKRRADN